MKQAPERKTLNKTCLHVGQIYIPAQGKIEYYDIDYKKLSGQTLDYFEVRIQFVKLCTIFVSPSV